MDVARVKADFDQQGYVVLDRFFDEAAMGELDRLTRDHFGLEPAWGHASEFIQGAEVEVVPWFPQREGEAGFQWVEEHELLGEMTTAVLGEGWRSDYCMAMHSRANSSGQAWHQDCSPEDAGQFNLNRLIYTHSIGGRRGGGLVVVPGSHRAGVLPVGDPRGPIPGQVVVEADVGSVVLLHGHCWHGVLPVGPEVRISLNYRALPAGAESDLTDICVYRNMRYRFSTAEVVENRT